MLAGDMQACFDMSLSANSFQVGDMLGIQSDSKLLGAGAADTPPGITLTKQILTCIPCSSFPALQ